MMEGTRTPIDEWDEYRDEIIRLYQEGHTKGAICKHLKTCYGFDTKPRQLEYRLQRWNIRKNIRKSEYQYIQQEVLKPGDGGTKDTDATVYLKGAPVPPEKLRRNLNRYHFPDTPPTDKNGDPALASTDISILSPPIPNSDDSDWGTEDDISPKPKKSTSQSKRRRLGSPSEHKFDTPLPTAEVRVQSPSFPCPLAISDPGANRKCIGCRWSLLRLKEHVKRTHDLRIPREVNQWEDIFHYCVHDWNNLIPDPDTIVEYVVVPPSKDIPTEQNPSSNAMRLWRRQILPSLPRFPFFNRESRPHLELASNHLVDAGVPSFDNSRFIPPPVYMLYNWIFSSETPVRAIVAAGSLEPRKPVALAIEGNRDNNSDEDWERDFEILPDPPPSRLTILVENLLGLIPGITQSNAGEVGRVTEDTSNMGSYVLVQNSPDIDLDRVTELGTGNNNEDIDETMQAFEDLHNAAEFADEHSIAAGDVGNLEQPAAGHNRHLLPESDPGTQNEPIISKNENNSTKNANPSAEAKGFKREGRYVLRVARNPAPLAPSLETKGPENFYFDSFREFDTHFEAWMLNHWICNPPFSWESWELENPRRSIRLNSTGTVREELKFIFDAYGTTSAGMQLVQR